MYPETTACLDCCARSDVSILRHMSSELHWRALDSDPAKKGDYLGWPSNHSASATAFGLSPVVR
jgi:hypothetical protein